MYNALSRASVVIQLQQDVEQYEATVVSTNGVILQPYDTSTTLIGSVLKNKEDITNKIKDIRWTKWNPSADNLIECPEWNRTHKGSHIIEVSKEDVDSKSIFTFEAYNTKGELLCTASISIIDINDLLVNTEKPLNPYPGQLWIDERTEPATLYVWNGYKWVIVGSVGTVVKNLLRNTAFLFNTDYWDIVGDTRLSFSPYGVDYLGHRFLKMASGVLTEERRGISQTTEDIIGTGAEYSFQMLYYSKEDTQTYSNNIKVNIYSVNSYGDETLITTKTVQAKADIKRLFFVFETRLDTKDIKVEILGEEGHRYNFFVGEIALYNTANDYPWTMHPLDLQLYGYTQEELWNILSNNGKIQGIFTRINPETGQLEYYINATYIGAGKMKAEYLDAYNLRVLRKDDDIVTLEITDNGDVNLRVNTLIINSANKTIEDIVSQIYMDQNRIELKVDNYKDELSSKISQTAEEIRLEVKNTKEDLESNISQTAEQIRLEVKNNKDELESSITQTAEQIRSEVKDTKDQLESSITQTASEIRAEVKDINDGLSSTISQTAEEIRAEVKDVNDNLTSTITQTASQIRAEVSDMDDRLTSSITQTAESIRSEVNDLDEKLTSSITQTADSIRSEVSDMDERLTSSITQTATDIRSEVSDLDERLTSSITQTATDIRSEVSELDKKVSSVTQSADQIKAEVKDLEENLTSSITQTAKDIRAEVKDINDNLTSSITQTAKDIRSEVKDINDNLTSSITQTASDIRSEVKDINDNLTSSITQTASDIRSEVSDLDKNLSSKIDQTAKDINLKVADNTKNISSLIDITAEGVYIDSNGSLVDINGEGVTIKATDITLDASNIHLEGYTTINQGFSIDKEGNMTAKDGKFSGTITGTNISGSTITGTTVTGGKIIGTVIQNAETNPTFSVSAEGVITGAAIKGGSIGIGGSKYDAFTVDNNGNCNITKGSISIGGNFVVGTNGILTATGANFTGSINAGSSITGTDISGGTITGTTIKNTNNTFSIDGNGNISGGSITIKDNFKVTSDGKLTAKNANFTGNINSGSTITGATIKNTSGTFQVDADGNIKGAAITGSSVSGGTITGATIQNSSGSFKVDGNGNIKGASISGSSISGGNISGTTISGGSLSIGDNFTVDTSGVLTAKGANISGTITANNGTIGGYTIDSYTLKGDDVGMSSNSAYAFWAGSSTDKDAPFKVGHNGWLYASNANITGTISATKGKIGGYTIGDYILSGSTVGMCSNVNVEWAFWAGADNGSNAPFHVGHNGKMYATDANISGIMTSSEIIGSVFRNDDSSFTVKPNGDIIGASVTSVNKNNEGTVVGYASYSPEGMEIYATNADKPTAYFTTAGSYVDNLKVDELSYYPMVRQANRNNVPSTFYVSDQATGDGSGRNENNYCDSIQDIIQSIWTDYGQVLCKNITIVVKSGSKITDDISIRGFGGWSDLTIKWEYNTQFWGTILVADNTIRVNFIGQTDGTDITFDPKTGLTEMRRRARFYTTPGQNGINVRNAYFSIQNFVALCNRSSGYDESYFISYNYGARGYVTCMDINNYKYAIYSGRGSTAGITNCCGDVKYYYYGAGGGIIVSGRRVPACSSGSLTGESDGMVFFHTNYSPIMYTSMYKYGTYSYKNSSGNTGDGSTGEVPVTKTTYTKTIALTNLRTTVSGSGATTSGKSGITGQGKWGNYKLHTGHATIPSSILNTLKAGNCTINNAWLIVTRQNTVHGYTGEVPYPVIDLGGARQSASGYKIAQGSTKTIPLNNDIKSALKSGASDLKFVGEGYSQYMFCSSVKLKVNYTITG